jgi:hypothetical protein
MSVLDVIVTFENSPQVFLLLTFSSSSPEDFVRLVLDEFSPEVVSEIVKISCCQLTEAPLPWILENNGKFYFNVSENPDGDTYKWATFKTLYLLEKFGV